MALCVLEKAHDTAQRAGLHDFAALGVADAISFFVQRDTAQCLANAASSNQISQPEWLNQFCVQALAMLAGTMAVAAAATEPAATVGRTAAAAAGAAEAAAVTATDTLVSPTAVAALAVIDYARQYTAVLGHEADADHLHTVIWHIGGKPTHTAMSAFVSLTTDLSSNGCMLVAQQGAVHTLVSLIAELPHAELPSSDLRRLTADACRVLAALAERHAGEVDGLFLELQCLVCSRCSACAV